MGRLSPETEGENDKNREHNIVVVMLEKELERKGREERKKIHLPNLIWGAARPACCLQVLNISN